MELFDTSAVLVRGMGFSRSYIFNLFAGAIFI